MKSVVSDVFQAFKQPTLISSTFHWLKLTLPTCDTLGNEVYLCQQRRGDRARRTHNLCHSDEAQTVQLNMKGSLLC
jgi:hypothetical protein